MNDKNKPVELTDIYNWYGKHPFSPESKKPAKLDEKNDITLVYGKGEEMIAPRNFVSTDKILVSIWSVPPGQSFEPPDIHSGDEPYYILKGEPTIVNPETGQCIQAKEGDAILIPRKCWHRVYNFTEEEVTVIAIIEGPIWDSKDIENISNYKLESVNYKGD